MIAIVIAGRAPRSRRQSGAEGARVGGQIDEALMLGCEHGAGVAAQVVFGVVGYGQRGQGVPQDRVLCGAVIVEGDEVVEVHAVAMGGAAEQETECFEDGIGSSHARRVRGKRAAPWRLRVREWVRLGRAKTRRLYEQHRADAREGVNLHRNEGVRESYEGVE
jgi:hypothetical protein